MQYADLTAAANLIGSILNATRGGYGDFVSKPDPLYPLNKITESINAAAAGIVQAILETKGHPFRDSILLMTTTVTQGQLIKTPVGAVYIDGDIGTELHPAKLRLLRAEINITGQVNNQGFYSLHNSMGQKGRIISFLGATCTIETVKDPTNLSGSDYQVPAPYYGILIDGGLHFAYSVRGANQGSASSYGEFYYKGLELIRAGKVNTTPEELVT